MTLTNLHRLTPQLIIAKKRKNTSPHTFHEISWFIQQFMEGNVKDYQMAAWLMAICLNGMNGEETASLTEAMVQSGEVMDWSCCASNNFQTGALPLKVDKHSTGGVGDKVSLVLAPLVASFGLIVPMMAGRGLGHTGGTIDKLESIPGFRTQFAAKELKDLLLSNTDSSSISDNDVGSSNNEHLGVSIVSPSAEICPADKRMYALRDVTSTVTSLPLQTSSIMSKKIAERPDSLILDVKFGKGSFNTCLEESLELARCMIETGELCGINTCAMVTRMDDPLGCAVGNWLEVKECIDIMTMGLSDNSNRAKRELSKDLTNLILVLAGQMLVQGKKASTLKEGIKMSKENLYNGQAWNKFRDMVAAQGGDVSFVESPEKYPLSKHSENVVSPQSGYISAIDSMEIGLVGVLLGAGRRTVDESIDFSAGIWFHKRPGMFVQKGDVLATLYTNREDFLSDAVERVEEAFSFSDSQVSLAPTIASFMTKNGAEDFDQSILLD